MRAVRSIAVGIAVAAIFAESWYLVSEEGLSAEGPLQRNFVYIIAYSYVVLALPPIVGGKRRNWAFVAPAGIAASLLLVADLTALRFFDTPFLKLYPFLPVTAGNASLQDLTATAASYVPAGIWLLAASTVGLALGVANLRHRDRSGARTVVLLLIPLLYGATSLSTKNFNASDPVISALMNAPQVPARALKASDHARILSVAGRPRAMPRTILLVIMESTGAAVPSSDGSTLLTQQIMRESGATGWVAFRNAVTNSNATDISVPTLLTGSGPTEPMAKIQAMPFVSQLAEARGYKTAFITAASTNFPGFDSFLLTSRFDQVATAKTAGLSFVNDLGGDDYFAYQAAAKAIRNAKGRLFMVLYVYSLHAPFQAESNFPIPATITRRRARAAFIAEAGFDMLFKSLRETNRMDDAFIVLAGDHGEFDNSEQAWLPQSRLGTFDGGILSQAFFLKAPASLPESDLKTLRGNAGRLVANLDVAPTISDMLGVRPREGLSYRGHSLLKDVPADRVAYSTSINEWRDWPRPAIAVSRGTERLTCSVVDLCHLSQVHGLDARFERPAKPDDDLFRLAVADPTLRRALGQIYRTHYRRAATDPNLTVRRPSARKPALRRFAECAGRAAAAGWFRTCDGASPWTSSKPSPAAAPFAPIRLSPSKRRNCAR
ncbi:MAG: sulfatase-like hydrolase/transferase [Croceibacterium sp.]